MPNEIRKKERKGREGGREGGKQKRMKRKQAWRLWYFSIILKFWLIHLSACPSSFVRTHIIEINYSGSKLILSCAKKMIHNTSNSQKYSPWCFLFVCLWIYSFFIVQCKYMWEKIWFKTDFKPGRPLAAPNSYSSTPSLTSSKHFINLFFSPKFPQILFHVLLPMCLVYVNENQLFK